MVPKYAQHTFHTEIFSKLQFQVVSFYFVRKRLERSKFPNKKISFGFDLF